MYVDLDFDLESTEHPLTLSLDVNRTCSLGPDFGRGYVAVDKVSRIVYPNTTEISTTRTDVHNLADGIDTQLNSVAEASGPMERIDTGVVAPYTVNTDTLSPGSLVTGTRKERRPLEVIPSPCLGSKVPKNEQRDSNRSMSPVLSNRRLE